MSQRDNRLDNRRRIVAAMRRDPQLKRRDDIARATELAQSTVGWHLTTLTADGVVRVDGGSKYRLGYSYSLTGKPIPPEDRRVPQRLIRHPGTPVVCDHTALAAALGDCLQPPPTPPPARLHYLR